VVGRRAALYRVCHYSRRPSDFNPGIGGPTRFGFFGEPVVPINYLARTPEAAVAESVLHNVPLHGGMIFPEDYLGRIMGRLLPGRTLRLAQFAGPGLRRLNVHAADLTDTDPDTYAQTVQWAQAVSEDTDLDGIVWMSRHWNTSEAVVLFGDRISATELVADTGFARAFSNVPDIEWLAALCETIGVGFVPPSS
jgi:hypothetical protein